MVPAQHVQAVELLLRALTDAARVPQLSHPGKVHQVIQARLIASPGTSFELRRRLEVDASRDPVDALNDAETLRLLARLRLNEAMESLGPVPGAGVSPGRPARDALLTGSGCRP